MVEPAPATLASSAVCTVEATPGVTRLIGLKYGGPRWARQRASPRSRSAAQIRRQSVPPLATYLQKIHGGAARCATPVRVRSQLASRRRRHKQTGPGSPEALASLASDATHAVSLLGQADDQPQPVCGPNPQPVRSRCRSDNRPGDILAEIIKGRVIQPGVPEFAEVPMMYVRVDHAVTISVSGHAPCLGSQHARVPVVLRSGPMARTDKWRGRRPAYRAEMINFSASLRCER